VSLWMDADHFLFEGGNQSDAKWALLQQQPLQHLKQVFTTYRCTTRPSVLRSRREPTKPTLNRSSTLAYSTRPSQPLPPKAGPKQTKVLSRRHGPQTSSSAHGMCTCTIYMYYNSRSREINVTIMQMKRFLERFPTKARRSDCL
jgi:hypothetical protein